MKKEIVICDSVNGDPCLVCVVEAVGTLRTDNENRIASEKLK
jgi:hypothetical protein